jgi:hypothetical protein
VVLRVGPDGAFQEEQLASGWAVGVQAGASRDELVLSWGEQGGWKIRALDRQGRPVGPAASVAWDNRSAPVLRHRLFDTGAGLLLALEGEGQRVWVAPVGRGASLGAFREIRDAGRDFSAVSVDGGLAWTAVAYDFPGDHSFGPHPGSWHAKVRAGFLPMPAGPATGTELLEEGGIGHTGVDARLLSRPHAAAVLIVPTSGGYASGTPRLSPLRLPPAGR